MAKFKNVPCPKTGKIMKVQLPPKPCEMVITCPHCGEKHRLQFGPESVDNSAEELLIEPRGVVGEEQHDQCPSCGKELVYTCKEGGIYHFECPHCHQKLRKDFENKTKPGHLLGAGRGQLVQVEKTVLGVKRKHNHALHEGQNVIGRYIEGTESDISIKGDNYMSRRSVSIDVIYQDNGFLYKLRVLRAANPVYVNDSQLQVDESRYLNFGDRIVLGKTMFTFEKKED